MIKKQAFSRPDALRRIAIEAKNYEASTNYEFSTNFPAYSDLVAGHPLHNAVEAFALSQPLPPAIALSWGKLVVLSRSADKQSYQICEAAVELRKHLERELQQSPTTITPSGALWSRPMTKTDMRVRLGNLPRRKFETFTKTHPVKQVGNRQLFQICLDDMDDSTRRKIEQH